MTKGACALTARVAYTKGKTDGYGPETWSAEKPSEVSIYQA